MNQFSIAILLLVATCNSISLQANDSAPILTAAAETASGGRSASAQKYGPTTQGETLAHVVEQVLTDASISNEQMMWALYTANPKAFEKGKLNNLRTGVFLTVPTPEQVRRIDAKIAHREIESRVAPPKPKSKPSTIKSSKTGDIDAQIEEAKHEREDAAKEQVFLKARLKEMEDKIQTLLRENAERDAKLRAQSTQQK